METALYHSLTALLMMTPAALLGACPVARRNSHFWGATGLAVAGSGAMALSLLWGQWTTGLAPALWVSVAVTFALFMALAAIAGEAWRLQPVLAPYLLGVGLLATVWQHSLGHPLVAVAPGAWLGVHIVSSVATYSLLTIAAVAALAAFLQERALKRKQPTRLTRQLPSVAVSEQISGRLLLSGEIVLALGLGTGMAVEWGLYDRLLVLDHKVLLSWLAFLLIGVLLVVQRLTGMRGRLVARLVLVSWLLLTLAYPGVKFVAEVLLGME